MNVKLAPVDAPNVADMATNAIAPGGMPRPGATISSSEPNTAPNDPEIRSRGARHEESDEREPERTDHRVPELRHRQAAIERLDQEQPPAHHHREQPARQPEQCVHPEMPETTEIAVSYT